MVEFVSKTGLAYFYNRIKNIFAGKAEFNTLSGKVETLISEGGEPNTIEIVKVNGAPLTPDASKAVDISIPESTSDLINDGDGSSNFATEEYVTANGGKIDVIKVNNVAQTITQKAVNITVPTAVSDLTNDSGYQNSTEVGAAITAALANSGDPYMPESEIEAKIKSEVSGVYKPQGAIAFSALPSLSSSIEGYVYDITNSFTTTADFIEGAGHAYPAGTNVVCVEHSAGVYKWDCLTGVIDLSAYWTSVAGESNSLVAATTAEIDAILDA